MKGYHFSEFIELSQGSDVSELPTFIPLHDHRTLSGKVKFKVLETGKMRKVYLYADAVLINETGHDLYTFSESKLLSGQKVKKIE